MNCKVHVLVVMSLVLSSSSLFCSQFRQVITIFDLIVLNYDMVGHNEIVDM